MIYNNLWSRDGITPFPPLRPLDVLDLSTDSQKLIPPQPFVNFSLLSHIFRLHAGPQPAVLKHVGLTFCSFIESRIRRWLMSHVESPLHMGIQSCSTSVCPRPRWRCQSPDPTKPNGPGLVPLRRGQYPTRQTASGRLGPDSTCTFLQTQNALFTRSVVGLHVFPRPRG